jgi:hypothetical protein
MNLDVAVLVLANSAGGLRPPAGGSQPLWKNGTAPTQLGTR